MRSLIIEFIYQRFDEDEDEDEGEDVYVENLIPGLPLRLQGVVKLHICLDGFTGSAIRSWGSWGRDLGMVFIWVKQCPVNS